MHKDRLKHLLELEKSNPADPFVKFAIAQAYTGLNESKKALEYYTSLLKNQPGYLERNGNLMGRFNDIRKNQLNHQLCC